MPIYSILCPDCGHVAKTLVLAGCRMPEQWSCSSCGGVRASPNPHAVPQLHPWETNHNSTCLCCGAPTAWECKEMNIPPETAQQSSASKNH